MNRPLDGTKVVVTRAKEQAGGFAALIKDAGAKVIHFPTIEFKEPDDLSVIDSAIKDLDAYDWIIFTSANGVRFFYKRLDALSKSISLNSTVRVAVVGPKTADALNKLGVRIDLVPEDYRAEGLISALSAEGITGKKVLIIRALYGREVLPDTLSENGANVTVAPVYETVAPLKMDKVGLLKTFDEGGEVILTFTSGSTVRNFFNIFDDDEKESIKKRVKIAVISPVTAEVVEKAGFEVNIMPQVYTAKDLADAIIQAD